VLQFYITPPSTISARSVRSALAQFAVVVANRDSRVPVDELIDIAAGCGKSLLCKTFENRSVQSICVVAASPLFHFALQL
jgi:hypothetical protein